jgi:hypothetical protein
MKIWTTWNPQEHCEHFKKLESCTKFVPKRKLEYKYICFSFHPNLVMKSLQKIYKIHLYMVEMTQ